jgi:hypothetical protein
MNITKFLMGDYKNLIPGIKRNISISNRIGSATKPMIEMIKPGSKMTKRNMAIIKLPPMSVTVLEIV